MKDMIQNDIVHGNIELNGIYEKMVTCSEFARLKDIIQTANSTIQYPELEKETRYEHSIGTYFLMSKAVNAIEKKLSAYGIQISKRERELARIAALLHDIGHGANSHLLEEITGQSHEARSIAIIKDKTTQIHQIIAEQYGEDFIEELVEFMEAIYGNGEIKKTITIENNTVSLKNMLASLVSSNVDLDRMDFLMRESTYTKRGTLTKPEEIFDSLQVLITGNQLELAMPKEKMRLLEDVILERNRNYEDVYFTPLDFMGNHAFKMLLQELRKHPEEVPTSVPEALKKFLTMEKAELTNQEYMQITNTPLNEALKAIAKNTQNEYIRYLCNYRENAKNDYQQISTDKSEEYIRYLLEKAIPGFPAKTTNAIFKQFKKIKPYKESKFGGMKIITNDGIERFENLKHWISLEPKTIAVAGINPMIMAQEMGMKPEEFMKQYGDTVQEVIRMLSKPKEEFELRYVLSPKDVFWGGLKEAMEEKFKVVDSAKYSSFDFYFDTKDFALLEGREALRTRKGSTTHKGDDTYPFKNERASYKKYAEDEEEGDYTTRKKWEEIGESLEIEDYPELIETVVKPTGKLEKVVEVSNMRRLITVNVNGHLVDISLNMAVYTENIYGMPGTINTIEVKPRENEYNGRLSLLEVRQAIEEIFPQLKEKLCNANIYEIAMAESYEKCKKGYINSDEVKEFEAEEPERTQRLKQIIDKIKDKRGLEFLKKIPFAKIQRKELEFEEIGE